MAEVKVKIIGLKSLQRQLSKSPQIVGKRLNEAINRATIILTNYLKTGGIVPVRTGQLKRSIRPIITHLKSTIAPHTNYAIFVHEGTRFQKSQPFLKTAIEGKQRDVQRQFDNAARDITNDLAK